ncbi:site-specific DNA-methyltransferase [Helicobacter pylori]|uniref:site-specific DNA-methyltransferase n=1 Tax=Helicobacter pylori TaxID=210 RepID=UPI0003AC8987|nr:site-specific DNA-methyltransferase [Helicobacter pylori]EPZ98080.1 type II restriction endonuclease [Helicobacter pylori UM085]WRC87002.1 site-specific DNA-methyltransferase [Helicobacter pylori]
MQNKEICGEKSVNEKNLEVFNRYFPGCLSMENDGKLTLDVQRLKALLGDFSEIKEEGYGLDFVGKKIALNQAFKKNNKILKPLNKSTSKHILIKGDNLDALKILKQSYSEKIKMIYIDPPYNTKNDNFIYGDDFSQSNEEVLKTLDYSKEKLDYIKNLFGSKCHSGWLSFMYPRLLLAKDLLKQDGVIFISIDDNECAQLKLLCDEIFGEDNFVGDFIRKTKSTTNDAKIGLNYQHEFLLCYAKNKEFVNLLGGEKNLENYKNPDNDPNGAWTSGNPTKPGYAKIQNFPLTNPYTKAIEYPPEGRSWVFTEKTIQNFINEGRLVFKKEHKEDERIFIYKHYLKDLKTTKKTFDSLIFSDNAFMNQTATKELLSLGMGEYFTYPKGVEFMKKIILHSTTPNSNDIILDFFAGSGTTAHAVLESNKSDYQKLSEGGWLFNGLNAAFKERRFILVQLDEKIDPKKNKSTHDFCLNTLKSTSPSIFDITEERIKRVGAKIKEACAHLDVGFRAFEIIDDETHDKNLNEANQKDLFAYSNPKKRETQTILIKLLCCENLELTTPISCLIENALYLALNTAFIVGDIEMSEVLENLKDKGVEKISMYMPTISNDRLCLELGSNLLDLKLESGDLKIRG